MSEASPPESVHRSPSYPSISLDEAIERAKVLYKYEKRNPTTPEVLVTHWGYSPKASNGRLLIATLKKYGLLEEVTGGATRVLRLTRLAMDIILLEEPEHREERMKAIQEAALMPKIHSDLWEKWGADLPSDPSIRAHLIRERNFNDSYVNTFIKEYKRTLSFAKLDDANSFARGGANDTIGESGDDEPRQTARVSQGETMLPAAPPAVTSPATPIGSPTAAPGGIAGRSGMMEMPVPVRDGICFSLGIPTGVSLKRSHFEQLRRYVKLLEYSLAIDASDESPDPD